MERAVQGLKPIRMRRSTNKKLAKNLGWAAAFILPGLILAAVFVFYPMVRNIQISLSSYKIVGNTTTFIGLENYRQLLLADPFHKFWLAYRNNLLYAVVTVPVTLLAALAFAVMINSAVRGAIVFRFVYYLPVITSWIIVGYVFQYLFNGNGRGLVNYVLVDMLHLLPNYVNWLNQTWTTEFVIWLLGIWKNTGWAMVIYLAALQGVPKDLYEAASIEGAGQWGKFWKITLPMLRPTTFFLTVQLLIGSFNVFLQVLVLAGNDPTGRTGVLQYLMYIRSFSDFNFGQGAAIGVLTAVSVLAVTLVLNRQLRRYQQAE
jgi:multiple sugar transport system permease protein